MATPINTLLIEGSFTELVEELAQYVDAIRRTAPENSVRTEIGDALEQLREKEQSEQELTATQQQQVLKERDDVLKKVVVAASALNAAPEKGGMHFARLLVHVRAC
jgi:translation initiation factor 3 subunit M